MTLKALFCSSQNKRFVKLREKDNAPLAPSGIFLAAESYLRHVVVFYPFVNRAATSQVSLCACLSPPLCVGSFCTYSTFAICQYNAAHTLTFFSFLRVLLCVLQKKANSHCQFGSIFSSTTITQEIRLTKNRLL